MGCKSGLPFRLASMADRNLVVQHNKIVEAKYKLSVGEQRLIKLLISMIEKDDEDFKPYRISVSNLSRLLDLSDNDFYRKINELSKKLISNVLTFKDGSDRELQVAWLSSAEYIKSKGIVELEFSPKLKPFLLQLKEHFTAYELVNVIRLKHTYSIRIYELLKQYERIGRRRFSIEKLRELLMMGDEEYKQFCDFRRWVLKVAQKELAEKTDIAFSWQEEKARQKCIAIEFIITSQKRPDAATIDVREANPANSKLIEQEFSIVSTLIELGVSKKTAEQLAKQYGEDHIREKIIYVQAQQREGKLKNPAGFLVEAIKNGYQDTQAKERKARTASPEEREEATRKQWEALKAKWSAWRKQRTEALIAALDPAALEREEAAFRASLAGNSALRKLVEKSAENAARQFRIHVAGQRAEFGLPEWARAVGADLSPFLDLARIEGKL
ncbi:MAG: RepB family plasmid replication initiator protein [Alphaproteobacteria bacterium]|nr:MAG: RepB family plasmid replication initiator protein [Alphaproteobacteria bacterium]